MAEKKVAPYGSWKSPITTDFIVSDTIRLGLLQLDQEDIYWIEGRPSEGGRNVIVRRTPDGKIQDMTPQGFNARTRVHEYGGGDFVVHQGTIYFSNFADQRLYRQTPGSEPVAISPQTDTRYADMVIDERRQRLISVCEDHTNTQREAVNFLVSLPLNGENSEDVHILIAGNDFYSNPRLSPDGSRLAYLTWNHPNMPWDGCELWVANLDSNGFISSAQRVAGGLKESIFQPEWSPANELFFVSDQSGWWNLYQWQENSIRAIYDKEAEFGLPQWVFGQTTFAFIAPERLICRYAGPKESGLALLNTSTGEATTIKIPEPYTSVGGIKATEQHIVFRASSPTTSAAIIHMDIQSGQFDVLRKSQNTLVNTAYLSIPQHIEFPTEHNLTAYAYYYPPKNEDYQAPADELPPLLVISHGGPTSSTSSELSLGTQYWTSRGFAVLDVDYGGSTGYGRPYRERLNGQWGIVDVDDCVNGAKYLVAQHLADPARLAIRGGSAGGYTTLAALTFRDTFKAGASHFGVSDIEGLAQDTHKFESRYMIGLVGPYPENVELYHERSPLYHTELFSCPVIFFQGLEDKIVPPNQAEKMVDALRARKIPVSYVTFEGEQHGFRKAENIKRSLEGEFYFYSRIFNYTPADTIKPVKIENM